MTTADLPSPIKAFLAEHIRSVVELEALLLLQRDPQRNWTAEELGKELRIDEQWAAMEIADLSQRGLVACIEGASTSCRYAPRTPEIEQAVQELARIYAERRVSVIQAIYAKPADPIQSFADAFRFRKERPNG